MTGPSSFDPFWDIAEELIGKTCWSALHVAGSIVDLDFGGRVPLHDPIVNPRKLRPDQAQFRGEINLELGDAPWILLDARGRIADSDDAPKQIESSIRCLEGKRVIGLGRSVSQYTDTLLWFSSGLVVEFEGRVLLAMDLFGELEEGDEAVSIRDKGRSVAVAVQGGALRCRVGAV